MFSGYGIIIGLFILAGLATAIWGGLLLARSRRTLSWPAAKGRIEVAEPSSPENDLLPLIEYSYTVEGRTFRGRLRFPAGTQPQGPEFAASFVRKYPAGSEVAVYYDPEDPRQSVLERGNQGGDWLVLALGLGAVVLGVIMLVL